MTKTLTRTVTQPKASRAKRHKPRITRTDWFVLGLFCVSGAAALVYEVSWMRQIGLLFGNTVHAAATVLGAYFGGMAAGYLAAASRAQRAARPLVGYGWCELAAAAWACLVPLWLDLLSRPPLAAWLVAGNPSLQIVWRAIVCFAILLPATAALGATLPLIAAHFSRGRQAAGSLVTLGYALNTTGAVLGVLTASFVLILAVGVRGSGFLAAGISAVCGLAAIWVGRMPGLAANQESSPAAGQPRQSSRGQSIAPNDRTRRKLWLVAVALVGFGTLALEVCYTRMCALVLQNSVYTFGLVVAVFLSGLALGAMVSALLARRMAPATIAAGGCLIGAPLAAISGAVFLRTTGLSYYGFSDGFAGYMFDTALLVSLPILPTVIVLGTVLPACWQACAAWQEGPAATVGKLTAGNTLGAMAGSFSASFLIMPALGIWGGISALGCLFAVIGASMLWVGARRFEAIGVALVAVAVIAAAHPDEEALAVPRGGQLLERWNSPYGWVDVIQRRWDGVSLLRQDIHYGLGSDLDVVWEKRQGSLPLLLHPRPSDVAVLGLGTGITACAAVEHPEVERIDVVELIPAVVEASRKYFSDSAGPLHSDPRVRLFTDDARHFLSASERRFDVIVADLFTPYHSQTGYLYTVEHYRVARQRLKPGGIFCQWLALWQLGPRDLEIIIDSFANEFPTVTCWWGRLENDQSMVALVGSESPLELDAESIQARAAQLFQTSPHPDRFLESVGNLSHLYLGQWPEGDGRYLNRDETPRVEFLAPKSYSRRELLRKDRLTEYFEQKLRGLAADGVRWTDPGGLVLRDRERRQAWQREQLERRVDRGKGDVRPPEFLPPA